MTTLQINGGLTVARMEPKAESGSSKPLRPPTPDSAALHPGYMNELQRILHAWSRLQSEGASAALATVVRVSGSTYRRPGARMLISEDGQATGSISGGCLERDVCRQAMRVMHTGKPTIAIYDSTDDEDPQEGFALGCNGIVEVRIEKLAPDDAAMAFLADCLRAPTVGAMATVIAADGPLAQAPGGRLLLRPGEAPQAVGIAEAELREALVDASRRALAAGRSAVAVLELGASQIAVFVELVSPPPAVLIFGAGHDAVPLVRFAKGLGWHVSLIDRRPGYATRARFREADVLLATDAAAALAQLTPNGQALAVVMNHNYPADLDCLGTLLRSPLGYLGVLGPKRRTERLLADLAERGVVPSEAQRRRLHSPVGLDIGADTPEEVALAIVAEMKAAMAGRGGGASRDRQGPLHERTEPLAPLPRRSAAGGAIACDTTHA